MKPEESTTIFIVIIKDDNGGGTLTYREFATIDKAFYSLDDAKEYVNRKMKEFPNDYNPILDYPRFSIQPLELIK